MSDVADKIRGALVLIFMVVVGFLAVTHYDEIIEFLSQKEEIPAVLIPEIEVDYDEGVPSDDGRIVLEKGKTIEFNGEQVTLIDVNPEETYCRISVAGETPLISKERSRRVGKLIIWVFEPIYSPQKMCGVYLR